MKTWFITGTSSGFGRILCEKLLKRGDRVVATLLRLNGLDDLKAQAGDRLQIVSPRCRERGSCPGGPSTDHSPISIAWRWWSVTPAAVCSAPQRRLPTIKSTGRSTRTLSE